MKVAVLPYAFAVRNRQGLKQAASTTVRGTVAILISLLAPLPVFAEETVGSPRTPVNNPRAAATSEILWLSGTGFGQTVDWEFLCTAGRNAGQWTTIPVPSQWELEGFGSYNYGHDEDKSREQGRYRHTFELPPDWRERRIDLVFDGVMTDAEVWLNGRSAGPKHQGGFYRFRYDITELVRHGQPNELEVLVSKQSANGSVNRAERDADYWVLGGIYRPVYLVASPAESIDHVAIDASHEGRWQAQVILRGLRAPARLVAQLETGGGKAVGAPFAVRLTRAAVEEAWLSTHAAPIVPWSAENPQLYRVRLRLERDGAVLHERRETFGFRSVEIRPGDGLYVNSQRVRLKGVNRHAFWPASGRTLNRELNYSDAWLIKAMNMNAVRLSHYPPDEAFLEACDLLGIYVLDELAGWHDAYSTQVGRQLVREMVERDVNHPSILFWNNGNEGGWNEALDGAFHDFDPQKRPVLHPDDLAGGLDTEHYLTWNELESKLDPASWSNRWRAFFGELPLVMPTEVLHGLYDGGSGAGLADYWRALRQEPRAAGFFLWSFSDESIVRTDRDRALDSDGNHAPDGILGPYREKSGSFYAVREILSPIVIEERLLGEAWDGKLRVENRYDMTDLAACRFLWTWIQLPSPAAVRPRKFKELGGELDGPGVPPGETGELAIPMPKAWKRADALRLTALDPQRREVWNWVLPIRERQQVVRQWIELDASLPIEATREGDELRLQAGATTAQFDLESGKLRDLARGEHRLALRGPWPAHDNDGTAPKEVKHFAEDDVYVVESTFAAGLDRVRFTLYPSGWLRLSYRYRSPAGSPFHGLGFTYPSDRVKRVDWLGDGPARVWKNRLEGGILDRWHKVPSEETALTSAAEPKLAGFYTNVYWAELRTEDGDLTLVFEDDAYLGFLSPTFPKDARHARAEVPFEGLTILHEIPAIGTKFHSPEELGPSGWRATTSGEHEGVVWLLAGSLREPRSRPQER